MTSVHGDAIGARRHHDQPRWETGDGTGHRVDPAALDHRCMFSMSGLRYGIDARGATVHGPDGVATALRPRDFSGVAARASEDVDGFVTVTLELMHADELLSIPLLIAHDLDDVAADWREWSRQFQLPMLMVEADGRVEELNQPRNPHDRRRRSAGRPRFLLRRRMGSLGVTMRVHGRELIARN